MIEKEFLPYDVVQDNSIKLAHRIYMDGFTPDVIYVSLRGGAYIGNIISEYFKTVVDGRRPVLYAAVVARSYYSVDDQQAIRIDGWTYNPDYLRQGDKVLLVDDIFDSGKTINYLAKEIIARGIPKSDLKIAVHDYKRLPDPPVESIFKPDYYCRLHDPSSEDYINWIHYMSHELVGLTDEEKEKHYLSKNPDLKDALSIYED